MLGTTARQALGRLSIEVAACRRGIPPRCHGFERAVAELERELDHCRGRWWPPWVREEELARLQGRTAELTAARAGFAALAVRLVPIEEKVRWLRQEVLCSGDPEVEVWLLRQCDGWAGVLARLGLAQRPAELAAEVARLADAEADVRQAEEALTVLAELSRALAALPGEAAVAPLADQLAGLRQEVLRGRATAEWLNRARRFLAPLVGLRPAGEDPGPRSTGQAEDLTAFLTRLQSWGRATGLVELEIAALAPRLLKGQEPSELLATAARDLLDRLLGRARELRDERLWSLERQLAALVKGCGLQPEHPDFQAGFDRLSQQTIAEPADHEAWLTGIEQLEGKLADLATLLEERLRAALHARLVSVAEALARLRTADLPVELVPALDRLAGAREALSELRAWRAVLGALERADELLAELASLESELAAERAGSERLTARRPELLAELRGLVPGGLRPQERSERERSVAELEALGEALPIDLRQRRQALAGPVARAEELLDRLHRTERRARVLLGALRARLEELHRADYWSDYGLGCSEMVDRVEALVHGVPAAPRAWGAVEEQLTLAEGLIDRLERHGRRLAAARVAELAGTLERGLRGQLEPADRMSAESLRRELDALGTGTLPPARWRRQAEELAQRVGANRAKGARR